MHALDGKADDPRSNRPAADAMRQWMKSYARFVIAKHAMHDAFLVALAPRSSKVPEMRTRWRDDRQVHVCWLV